MNALIGLEDKSQLVLSSSGIGLPQPLPAMESETKAGSPR